MRHFLTVSAFLFGSWAAVAQTPVTLTSANYPVYTEQNYRITNNPPGVSLTPSANGTWNFSAIQGGDLVTDTYYPEFDPFYLDQGVDVYASGFKNLTSQLGYLLFYEFDFNDNGVYEKGLYVDAQAYSLGAFTGNNADSIKFPTQGSFFQGDRVVMKFPATYQTKWQSNSRRSVDFTLSVAAAGLNNVPGKHVFRAIRTDSIAGWGQMRVYVNGAPSIPYDVLINRTSQYVVDSFFLAGAPAPQALLNAFGITQGQQSAPSNRYLVYRPGTSSLLTFINYGSNNYTTPTSIGFDTDDLVSGTQSPDAVQYATLLFPNPGNGAELNLQILGPTPTLSTYSIFDQQGRLVKTGTVAPNSSALHFDLQGQLDNGQYVLQVFDNQQRVVVAEPFVVANR